MLLFAGYCLHTLIGSSCTTWTVWSPCSMLGLWSVPGSIKWETYSPAGCHIHNSNQAISDGAACSLYINKDIINISKLRASPCCSFLSNMFFFLNNDSSMFSSLNTFLHHCTCPGCYFSRDQIGENWPTRHVVQLNTLKLSGL